MAVVNTRARWAIKAILGAWSRVLSSYELHKISEHAGRLERIAAAKLRSTIRAGVGEVHNVKMGADLGRLLVSEPVSLLPHTKLPNAVRCSTVMKGRGPQGRGGGPLSYHWTSPAR